MRYFKKIIAAVVLLATTIPCSAFQQSELQNLLKIMRNSRHLNAYTAEAQVERSFRDNNIRHTMKIVNRPPETFNRQLVLTEGQKERMRQMRKRRGRGQEEFQHRNFRNQMRQHPGPMSIDDINLLNKNYEFSITEGIDIAGRPSTRLEIVPKLDSRPLHRFWLDRETGVILKRELFETGNETGPMFREMITSIQYEDFDREYAEKTLRERRENRFKERTERKSIKTEEFVNHDELPDDLRESIVIPNHIPAGFELDRLRVFREKDIVAFHQVFSDGLLKFSLFQSPAGGPTDRRMKQRNTQQMRIFIKRDKDTRLILAGYLPRHIMRPVFESLPGEKERSRR